MGSLRNRFFKADRDVWMWHYSCFYCGQNTWDALHHINAPTDDVYVEAKHGEVNHNRSILNSAPVCNQKCHIGNEAQLAKIREEMLKRTLQHVLKTDYEFKERDNIFLYIYQDLYE